MRHVLIRKTHTYLHSITKKKSRLETGFNSNKLDAGKHAAMWHVRQTYVDCPACNASKCGRWKNGTKKRTEHCCNDFYLLLFSELDQYMTQLSIVGCCGGGWFVTKGRLKSG